MNYYYRKSSQYESITIRIHYYSLLQIHHHITLLLFEFIAIWIHYYINSMRMHYYLHSYFMYLLRYKFHDKKPCCVVNIRELSFPLPYRNLRNGVRCSWDLPQRPEQNRHRRDRHKRAQELLLSHRLPQHPLLLRRGRLREIRLELNYRVRALHHHWPIWNPTST